MKHRVLVAFLMLWLTGCGRVGDPHAPAIRIPAKISDLRAVQNQNEVTLTWTNPSKYVDGSTASDLTSVRILRNGFRIQVLKLSGIGKMQSVTVDVSGGIGATQTYVLEVETQRGKVSDSSNSAAIAVVGVPGPVLSLSALMDQGRIRLDWQPPERNTSFADVYIVRRADLTVPAGTVKDTHFEDTGVEAGKTYTYTVSAAHGVDLPVPGQPSAPKVVVATDERAPAVPTGLQPPVVSDAGAILRWDVSTESDLAGYRVYRSDNPDSGFTRMDSVLHTIPSVRDDNYRPGLYYEVSAEDVFGNESAKSSPVRAP